MELTKNEILLITKILQDYPEQSRTYAYLKNNPENLEVIKAVAKYHNRDEPTRPDIPTWTINRKELRQFLIARINKQSDSLGNKTLLHWGT